MGNDPSQTSQATKLALEDNLLRKAFMKSHPDLNPIENIFHFVKHYLDEEAISKNIIRGFFDEFSIFVLEAFGNMPVEIIDKTISSMNRRITAILASKGERIKY